MRIYCKLLPILFIFITTGLVVTASRSRKSDIDFRSSDRCKGKPCHNPVQHPEPSVHDKNEHEKNPEKQPEDKVTTKCVAQICNEPKTCQSMAKKARKCSLKYCNNGKCSAQKPNPHNNGKEEPENKEVKNVHQESERKYNRFTPVKRKYSYKGRRSKETRSTRFNRCILDRLKMCRKCRTLRRHKRDDGPLCDQLDCGRVLGKLSVCSHYTRVVDFWKRRVEEEVIQRRHLKYNKLTVKDSDGTERGRLTYNVLNDIKGRPYLYIIYVNASKQGGGAGRALMEHVMEKIAIEKYHKGVSYGKRKMGYVKLELLNGTGNVHAHNLYKNLGFSFDSGECESGSCPSMTLDLRNYQSGDKNWEKPKLDDCAWNNKQSCGVI